MCNKVVYSDEDLLIVYSRIYKINIIEPLAIASSIILALSLERALIADTPIVTKKYVISLTLIVSVLNLNIAKIAKSPNAKPKSNFTLLVIGIPLVGGFQPSLEQQYITQMDLL